jgi:general secretion pathway protein F
MALYRYRAQDKSGEIRSGQLEAASLDEVIRTIKSRKLYPLKIRQSRKFGLRRGVSDRDVISLFRDLGGLMKSGLSMDRALALSAANVRNKSLGATVKEILERVQQGGALSDAVAEHSEVFGRMPAHLIKAGETSGKLTQTIEDFVEHLDRQRKFRQRLVSALVYPSILLAVSVVSILVLVMFVIPKFARIFDDLNQEMPAITKMLLDLGTWLGSYYYALPLGLLALYLAVKAFLGRPDGRKAFDKLALRTPLLRGFILDRELSRYFRTLGLLLQGGVPMMQAIGLGEQLLSNQNLKNVVQPLKGHVKGGRPLSQFFSGQRLFPERVGTMLYIAEEQGSLAGGLLQLGESYELDMQRKLETMATLAEPSVIILTGLFIGITVLSMFSAIFGVTDIQM